MQQSGLGWLPTVARPAAGTASTRDFPNQGGKYDMTASDAYSIIRSAIRNKTNISATYQGHYRELSPHVVDTKDGRRQALLYQFGGTSSSGLGPMGSGGNWRCIPIDAMRNVAPMGGTWHTAPTHSQEQTCVDLIDVEVSH